jgi:hypothetical protein
MPGPKNSFISARAARQISFEQCAHLSDLPKAGGPSIFWLNPYAEVLSNSPLLFPELANAEILEQHQWGPTHIQGVGLSCLPDALVSGKSLVGDENSLFELGPLVPTYVDNYLRRAEPDVGDTSLADKSKRHLPGVSFLLTHWNSDVYGHWLLEGLPKLLLLQRLGHLFPDLRIVVPSVPAPLANRLLSPILRRGSPPSNAASYVRRWVDIVLPGATVETYDPVQSVCSAKACYLRRLYSARRHFTSTPNWQRCSTSCQSSLRARGCVSTSPGNEPAITGKWQMRGRSRRLPRRMA